MKRVAAYLAALATVFAVALGVGAQVGVVGGTEPVVERAMAGMDGDHGAKTAGEPPKGLQVTQDGYTLDPAEDTFPLAGGTYRFRVLDARGRPVTDFERTHERDLHLIVVRRDLAGFAHLHPTMAPDGTWTVALTPAAGAGTYRVFADFTPAGHDGLTLGTDLAVPGDYRPAPLAPESAVSTVDGLRVTMRRDGGRLTFTVTEDGRAVRPEPYLGARGHLVALRVGDLGFLHVHPDEDSLAFDVEVPSSGVYRLFLDVKYGGVVRTAEFTVTE